MFYISTCILAYSQVRRMGRLGVEVGGGVTKRMHGCIPVYSYPAATAGTFSETITDPPPPIPAISQIEAPFLD